MTESEICRSFLWAKYPQKQIKTLAQLNCISVEDIRKILTARGIDPTAPRPIYTPITPIGGGTEVQLPRRILKEATGYATAKRCAK